MKPPPLLFNPSATPLPTLAYRAPTTPCVASPRTQSAGHLPLIKIPPPEITSSLVPSFPNARQQQRALLSSTRRSSHAPPSRGQPPALLTQQLRRCPGATQDQRLPSLVQSSSGHEPFLYIPSATAPADPDSVYATSSTCLASHLTTQALVGRDSFSTCNLSQKNCLFV